MAPSGSLLQLLRRSWYRRRLSTSLLWVACRSGRFSGSVADCLRISCMCPEGIGTITDCLGVSYWRPDGLCTVAHCLGVSCRCPANLKDCLAQSQTVLESPPGAQTVMISLQTSGSLLQVLRRSGRLSGSVADCFGVCRCQDAAADC